MEKDRKITPLALIKQANDMSAYALLKDKTTDDQMLALKQLFDAAVGEYNDDQAKLYFEWLLAGMGLVNVTDEHHQARVDCLMKMWNGLPATAMETVHEYVSHNESVPRQERGVVLLKTKQKILEQITARWRETADEDEADRLFVFVQKLKYTYFDEERKMREEVIRKAVDHRFPVVRLERHLLNFGETTNNPSELWRTLVGQWALNSKPMTISQQLTLMEPLAGASCSACDLAERLMYKVAELDRRARILENALIGDFQYQPGHDRYRKMVDSVQAEPCKYGKLDTNEMASFEVDLDYSIDVEIINLSLTAIAFWGKASELLGNQLFVSAKQLIRRWQVDYRLLVHFEFKLYGDKVEKAFFREHELLTPL